MSAVLAELELLLEEERSALCVLDGPRIEACAARKLVLTEALRAQELDRAALERVALAAQRNQLLAAHARACVRGVLDLASGGGPAYPRGSSRPAAPLRVDTRG